MRRGLDWEEASVHKHWHDEKVGHEAKETLYDAHIDRSARRLEKHPSNDYSPREGSDFQGVLPAKALGIEQEKDCSN